MKMKMNTSNGLIVTISLLIISASPIQLQIQNGEASKNDVNSSELNKCLNSRQNVDVGFCVGKEVLAKLDQFNEADAFPMTNGIEFVRDEKTPRDFGSFLDKDPMDFRAIMEDASSLISKRSLRWDLSFIYPGLTMRVGPTLANGMLEFVMDPRFKDRTYGGQYNNHGGELSTGRLLARNLLVPFLLGFKFQLSTLLPLLLGLVLIASKKAFLLSKIALLAATIFGGSSSNSGYSLNGNNFGGYSSEFGAPSLASYTAYEHPAVYHGHHGGGSAFFHRPHHSEYFREKSDTTTAAPISPGELRDRLERLFVTKQNEEPRDSAETIHENKVRNARNFAWTPIGG